MELPGTLLGALQQCSHPGGVFVELPQHSVTAQASPVSTGFAAVLKQVCGHLCSGVTHCLGTAVGHSQLMVSCLCCGAPQAAAVAQQLQQAMAELRPQQRQQEEAGEAHGACAAPVVALLLPRSLDYITAVLGVVYAG
jgi:non-ribosomal peptide synthetase component F